MFVVLNTLDPNIGGVSLNTYTSRRFKQPKKAFVPILESVDLSTIDFNSEQPWNAQSPIYLTELGIINSPVRPEQSLNVKS